MLPPDFTRISSTYRFENAIRRFFIEGLEYSPQVQNDPSQQVSPRSWRFVFPLPDSRPIAVAHRDGLSRTNIQQLRRLYIDEVVGHRDDASLPRALRPVAYCLTDGARWVLFSASADRTRDDRFDLSPTSWEYENARQKYWRLSLQDLTFTERLGTKQPDLDFLFEGVGLSADRHFRNYAFFIRRALMGAVVDDDDALAAVVWNLIETPEDRSGGNTRLASGPSSLSVSRQELFAQTSSRLGEAVTAAVDTLLLRHLMMRFIEVHHPQAMGGLLTSGQMLEQAGVTRKSATIGEIRAGAAQQLRLGQTLAPTFSETELELAKLIGKQLGVDLGKGAGKGNESQQLTLFEAADDAAFTQVVLDQERARAARLGGDFYLADLGAAAGAIEHILLTSGTGHPNTRLLQDFLGRTASTEHPQWDFRYEDLRPQTLQEYYEDSLSTVVGLRLDKATGKFEVEVGTSRVSQKQLGAYYTDSRLCHWMVGQTLRPLFGEHVEAMRAAIRRADETTAIAELNAILCLSVCDPTMGSAPFLRAAFQYLANQYHMLCSAVAEGRATMPAFWKHLEAEAPFFSRHTLDDERGAGAWEWHILRQMLYGVDIDLKAVCISCQTFTLSALNYLKQAERFPSFFNVNLKLGNALISPVRPEDRAGLAEKYGSEIAQLIDARKQLMTLPNTAESYERLRELTQDCERVLAPIRRALAEERVMPALGGWTEAMRPFVWELEFPEVFFGPDGTLKEQPGFDVVIGNPPWETITLRDSEFAEQIGEEPNRLQAARAAQPAVERAYTEYRTEIASWKSWVSAGGQYEHQQGGRDRNKWRMATELSWKLTRTGGAMSLVIPSGIIADDAGYALKRWLFAEGTAGPFVSFDESNNVFSGTQAFTIVQLRKLPKTRSVRHVEGLTDAGQLEHWPFEPVEAPMPLIEKMSPGVLAIPSVRDGIDESILEKLYAHPLIGDSTGAWYSKTVSYDYHMGNDRGLFRFDGNGIPLLEGKSIEQYAVLPESELRIRVARRTKCEPNRQYRIAVGAVAGALLTRRLVSTLVPHDYATGHALHTYLVDGSDARRLYLAGALNSFVAEWRLRQLARNNNISKFILEQVPVPRPNQSALEQVACLVARLITSDNRFDDLRPYLGGAAPARDPQERWRLKCEIDAHIAHHYGLTHLELERVLSGFTRVPQTTRQEVLARFDALA